MCTQMPQRPTFHISQHTLSDLFSEEFSLESTKDGLTRKLLLRLNKQRNKKLSLPDT